MLVGLVVLAAGCSSGPTAAEMIRNAFARYMAAFTTGNGQSACLAMSSSFQAKLVAAGRSAGLPSASCASILDQELKGLDSATRARQRMFVRATRVSAVSIRGAAAQLTVATRLDGVTESARATAVREHGRWKISQPPGRTTVGRDLVYDVPSTAMSPTLRIGETILADPSAYRARAPAVGDIIVFHPPAGAQGAVPSCGSRRQGAGSAQACDVPTDAASTQIFVKRIVAGPGDRVRILRGVVVRNGVAETEPFRIACPASNAVCSFPATITVPAGEYFVVGDNRAESDDSRFWGPVKRSWIIGPVVRRLR